MFLCRISGAEALSVCDINVEDIAVCVNDKVARKMFVDCNVNKLIYCVVFAVGFDCCKFGADNVAGAETVEVGVVVCF